MMKNMKKLSNALKVIFAISVILLLISSISYFLYGVKGKVFLNVDDDNEAIIYELCSTSDIVLVDDLKQIGCKQCLGDWELYLKYENGNSDWSLLNDTVGGELRSYIKENGQIGGTSGQIAYCSMVASMIVSFSLALYVIIFKIKNGSSANKR